jgi:hypothetical protein
MWVVIPPDAKKKGGGACVKGKEEKGVCNRKKGRV